MISFVFHLNYFIDKFKKKERKRKKERFRLTIGEKKGEILQRGFGYKSM